MIRKFLYSVTWSLAGRFNQQLVTGPLTYNQDGLASRHNTDFLSDPKFAKAYAAGERTKSWGGKPVHWRAFTACWAAQQCLQVKGDFVECGVNRGGLARTIMDYVSFETLQRSFYLLDTFKGLDVEYITDVEKASGLGPDGFIIGGYEECYEDVRRTFSSFPNVRIVRGSVPETLDQIDSDCIAFASIDMNSMIAEIAAAEFIWPRLSSGGVLLLDDYGWNGHIEQKKAFDKFAADRSLLVLSLPTGQGLIIKP